MHGTDIPLRIIAERCGYSSEYACSKAFKREYGVPPNRYRRRQPVPAVQA
ncbi:helix-turn-helix domain-containing protein [Nocardia sp. alder85J]|nr:helix-turn-helix domain-containing protein [Nocardia sp. alder85J]MCX4095806.1 AraC family transcriptional regulator [Nocardia sp. alder85J]